MKLNSPIIRKAGATALGILLLIYIGYQIFLVSYKGLETETAMYAERSDSISVTGWAARNEEILTNNNSGVLSYKVADGEKVAKGDIVANVYANEDSATSQSRIKRIDTEITNLEILKNAGDYYSSTAELIGVQINTSMDKILSAVKKNDFSSLYNERDHLQYLMNQKRIIIGSEAASSYQARIDELKLERENINSAATERTGFVDSSYAGYFITNTDGYEHAFDIEKIKDITVTDIDNIQKSSVPPNSVGKISKDFNWYVLCIIDEQQKIKLERVNEVKVEIPLATTAQISAKVVCINKDEASGKYAVVLECADMNVEVASIRKITMQIVVADYSGVLVNQKAIHFSSVTKDVEDENGNIEKKTYDNIKGVYTKFGERISFTQIFSDITINGYAICKLNLSETERANLVTDDTIKLYDEVVIEGTNLYDGKLS